MSCAVGLRHALELVLLWLWHRLAAEAPIRTLAWEFPYAMGAALKSKKKKQTNKKQKLKKNKKQKSKHQSMWIGEEYINNISGEARENMDHRSNPILTSKIFIWLGTDRTKYLCNLG